MSAALPAEKRVDTSHITSPRDPMTAEERAAVRQELREAIEAIWRVEVENGSVRDELHAMFGSPIDALLQDHTSPDAA